MWKRQKRHENKRDTAARPERENQYTSLVSSCIVCRADAGPKMQSPPLGTPLNTHGSPLHDNQVTAAGRTTLPFLPRSLTPAYHVIDAVHGLTKVRGLEANVGIRLEQRVIVDPPRRHVGVEVMAHHNGRVCRSPLRLYQHRRGRACQGGGIPVGGRTGSGRGGPCHGQWRHVLGRRGGHREWSGEVVSVDDWACRQTDVRIV